MRRAGLKERFGQFLTIGEVQTFAQLAAIVSNAKRANESMARMMAATDRATLQCECDSIKILEQDSDDMAFTLKGDISSGAISPMVLDNLLRSVEIADTLVDDYYFACREINRMPGAPVSGTQDSNAFEFEEKLGRMLAELVEHAGRALDILLRLLSSRKASEMHALREEIEKIEEQGDNVKDSAFDALYAESSRLHFLQFNHYSELLHKFDDILDGCEDLSDIVLSIVSSMSK